MGITEEALVVQKVAIWEGMDVAKQSGTVSGTVSKLELLIAFPFRGCMELLLIGGGNRSSTMCGISWIFAPTLMALKNTRSVHRFSAVGWVDVVDVRELVLFSDARCC